MSVSESSRFRHRVGYAPGAARRAAFGLSLALAGCGGGGDNLPREAVSGRITVEGRPLDRGAIQFLPTDLEGGVAAWAKVSDGAYEIARAEGPVPGEYTVSIVSEGDAEAPEGLPGEPPKQAPRDALPDRYGARSTLRANVEAGKPNVFDFRLTLGRK